MSAERHATALTLVAIVVLWEIAGDLDLVASGALPSPSEIAIAFWRDKADYWPHILATVRTAAIGFAIGNTVAVFAAILFVRVPVTERLARGIPLKRIGEPDDVAYCVLYLASDESKFVTGAEFKIDGGMLAQ